MTKHTPGAIRAAEAIVQYQRSLRAMLQASELAEIIDRETSAPELLEACEKLSICARHLYSDQHAGLEIASGKWSLLNDLTNKAADVIAKAKPKD